MTSDLREVVYAYNAHRSAEKEAEGFETGMRARNLRAAKRRLETMLWRYRDDIVKLIKETRP